MASVNTNTVKKSKSSPDWNIEKLGNNIFKLSTANPSKKAKIRFAGVVDLEIDRYYLQLPSNLTGKEVDYILTKSPAELISDASIAIEYYAKYQAIIKECEKITLTTFRNKYHTTERLDLDKQYNEYIADIIDITNMITPYSWQIVPIFDSITIENVSVSVDRGQREFLLRVS